MPFYPSGGRRPTTKYLIKAGVVWIDTLLAQYPVSKRAKPHLIKAQVELLKAWASQ